MTFILDSGEPETIAVWTNLGFADSNFVFIHRDGKEVARFGFGGMNRMALLEMAKRMVERNGVDLFILHPDSRATVGNKSLLDHFKAAGFNVTTMSAKDWKPYLDSLGMTK